VSEPTVDQVECAGPVRAGAYGDRVAAVEPGGVEYIPLGERHGRPRQLLWTFAAPNMEFATIFVGVLAVSVFGLGFGPAIAALLVGNVLGSLSHGILAARGPRHGVPQMVLSRVGFGFWGNALPAGLNAVCAGIGWFAVNSVSGTFALSALTGMPTLLSLVVVVAAQVLVAFFGHNLVHAFEKYALVFLGVVFLAAGVAVLTKAHPGAVAHPIPGAFLLTASAAFSYVASWNPYAADYSRYLGSSVSPTRTGIWAGLGVFVSCTVLEVVGVASATAGGAPTDNPTGAFTALLPGWLADLTLLAIMVGAVSANVLNVYSGSMSFLAIGIRLPGTFGRALVAVVFGLIGYGLAWAGLHDAGTEYEDFLLVLAYWIGPWLGVVLTDQFLRRGRPIDQLLYATWYRNWAGPLAMAVAIVVSVALFSNQTLFTGLVPRHLPGLGDIAFLVGFAVAAGLYTALRPAAAAHEGTPTRDALDSSE
jgi:NCS1 family nucleobase:cation symporter-1